MSHSEKSSWDLGPGEPRCGGEGCSQGMRFNSTGELVHFDGTDLCVLISFDGEKEYDRVKPLLGDEKLPAWARLEARHRTRIEEWEQRREPSGWAVALLTIFVLLIAFSCIGYSLLGMSALGLDFPWS